MRRSRLPALVAALALGLLAALPSSGTAAGSAAGKPAPVKITLKPDSTGRVISDRRACVSEVDVFGFFRGSNGAITPAGQTTTDNRGRYPSDARRGVVAKAFTLVLGNAKCRVAQSDDTPISMRAGKPAQRKVTLKATQTGLSGRVSSKRAGCFKSVPVEIFAQLGPGQPWTDLGALVTDNQGRYDTSGARPLGSARGASVKVAAVTLGTKNCRVAQSPTRTVSAG